MKTMLELLNKYKLGLLMKVTLIVLFTTTFTLSFFGLYQYMNISGEMTRSLQERFEKSAERLTINLKKPLYYLDGEAIRNIIFSEMKADLIVGVFVLEGDKLLYGFSHNETNGIVVTKTVLQDKEYMVISKDIVEEDGKSIGSIKIFISLYYLRDNLRRMRLTIIAQVIVLDILIVMVLILCVRELITKPITKCVSFTKDISAGDFSRTLEISNKDEIGELALSLNMMTSNLSKMLKDLTVGIEILFSSSSELSTISCEMSVGAEETTAIANTVAVSTEQISTTINSIASASEEMSVNIQSISSTAEEMSQNMNSVASSIEEMSVSVRNIAQNSQDGAKVSSDAMEKSKNATSVMAVLGDAAKEIGKVTLLIKRIAEQTNLLALNATIEAASAGDAGRGFAVVANEIKELARQSSQAAEDIARRIEGVQKNTSESVQAIEMMANIIRNMNELSLIIMRTVEQQTITTNDISANVQQLNIGSRNIASAIAEIAKGSNDMSRNAGEAAKAANEVANNIQGVSQAANDSSTAASRVNMSAGELEKIASDIRNMVSKFKI